MSVDRLRLIEEEAREQLAGATSVAEVDEVAGRALGKRSPLGDVKRGLGGLDADERKAVGRALNDTTKAVEAAVVARRAELEGAEHLARLEAERLDLTEAPPSRGPGHLHIVTQTIEHLEDVFVGMGYEVAEGPEVETDWYNFEALNIPPHHPSRSMWDTLYLDAGEPESTLLRTHTSPVQIRWMQEHPPPVRIVAPGRVYRADTADATHMPVFHQIEGLVVDRDITFGDLAGTIEAFCQAYFGRDFHSRLRPSYFPFTEPSAEFDIQQPDGTWLEMGGCGMVHPKVFEAVGYDPEEWTGFAFGFGIDRMAKDRFAVPDLRELFTNDIRFLSQF